METKTADKLNERQKAFCWHYGIGMPTLGNGMEAARAAGYKGSDNMLCVTASRLISQDKIRNRIEHLQREQHAEQTDRREKRLKQLDDIADNPELPTGVRIKAIELEGKMCGWLSETRVLETRSRQVELDASARRVAELAALAVYDTRRLPDGTLAPHHPQNEQTEATATDSSDIGEHASGSRTDAPGGNGEIIDAEAVR